MTPPPHPPRSLGPQVENHCARGCWTLVRKNWPSSLGSPPLPILGVNRQTWGVAGGGRGRLQPTFLGSWIRVEQKLRQWKCGRWSLGRLTPSTVALLHTFLGSCYPYSNLVQKCQDVETERSNQNFASLSASFPPSPGQNTQDVERGSQGYTSGNWDPLLPCSLSTSGLTSWTRK